MDHKRTTVRVHWLPTCRLAMSHIQELQDEYVLFWLQYATFLKSLAVLKKILSFVQIKNNLQETST